MLSGLNPTATYTLTAYLFDNDGTEASVGVGSTLFYYAGATNGLSAFTEATSTSSAAPTVADYAQFTLTGSAMQTLTITPIGTSLLGLNGFQLSEVVPEPSTYALCALSFLGLTVACRRTRSESHL